MGVEPEPIQDGAGWPDYAAPTRPAGPNPLTMNGQPAHANDLAAPANDLAPAYTGLTDGSKLIRLHESIAALLASRGEWRQAYQHLRSALDLVYSDRVEQPPVPAQLLR